MCVTCLFPSYDQCIYWDFIYSQALTETIIIIMLRIFSDLNNMFSMAMFNLFVELQIGNYNIYKIFRKTESRS